jgi:ribosome recycling factor
MQNEVYSYCEEQMSKSITHLDHEFNSLRTGRATPSLLEGIKVDYYGSQTPLSQCATISVPEARLLVIQPWDKSLLSAVEKAIQAANLGLNPINDGALIRVPIPALTDDRRQELIKIVHNMTEEGRIAVRSIRREANENIKKLEKDKDISEDNSKDAQAEIQKITDKYTEKMNEMQKGKEKAILDE